MKNVEKVTGIQGTVLYLEHPVFCDFYTHVNDAGKKAITPLKLTGRTSVRTEFGEQFTEFETLDPFGESHFLSESDLYQDFDLSPNIDVLIRGIRPRR